ncbi:hypothetical protein LCGC14_3168940, partial [marine sediment metagenome]
RNIWDWVHALGYWVTDMQIFGLVGTSFVGDTTPAENTVPSNRAVQRIVVPGVTGWDWFGANRFGVSLSMGATTTTKLLCYNISLEFEVENTVQVPPDPATMQLYADVVGFVGASGTKITGAEAIVIILADFVGTDYDSASLTTATDSVTSDAGLSADSWWLARRIADFVSLRELLATSVMAAGIRYAFDSGKILFFDNLRTLPADFLREIDKDVLLPGLVRKKGVPLDIVVNQVALSYDRQYSGERQLAAQVVSDSTISQALAWGTRQRIVTTEWVNDSDVATALADHLKDDFSWQMSKVHAHATASAIGATHKALEEPPKAEEPDTSVMFG